MKLNAAIQSCLSDLKHNLKSLEYRIETAPTIIIIHLKNVPTVELSKNIKKVIVEVVDANKESYIETEVTRVSAHSENDDAYCISIKVIDTRDREPIVPLPVIEKKEDQMKFYMNLGKTLFIILTLAVLLYGFFLVKDSIIEAFIIKSLKA